MKCPACSNTLSEMKVDDLVVDVCQGGCGGIWFDNYELRKVDEQHEHHGESLLDIAVAEDVTVDHNAQFPCPKCEAMVMHRHFFSVQKAVEVDECPGCGGIWLDEGELRGIRSMFKTEQERQQAAAEYFNKAIGPELEKMRARSAQDLEKARKIANAFKFICPSYYIPGKQDGAAF